MTRCNMVLWVEGLAGNQEFWIPVSAQIVALHMVMGSYSSEREANIPAQPPKSCGRNGDEGPEYTIKAKLLSNTWENYNYVSCF